MISRLMLSLKKASKSKGVGWTADALSGSHVRTLARMEFGRPSDGPEDGGGTTSDEVALSDLSDGQVGERSEEGTA